MVIPAGRGGEAGGPAGPLPCVSVARDQKAWVDMHTLQPNTQASLNSDRGEKKHTYYLYDRITSLKIRLVTVLKYFE